MRWRARRAQRKARAADRTRRRRRARRRRRGRRASSSPRSICTASRHTRCSTRRCSSRTAPERPAGWTACSCPPSARRLKYARSSDSSISIILVLVCICWSHDAAIRSQYTASTWICLDGPTLQSEWIDALVSALSSRSRSLQLCTGENLQLEDTISIVFETDSLAEVSPATIGKCV